MKNAISTLFLVCDCGMFYSERRQDTFCLNPQCFSVHYIFPFATWTFVFCHHYLNLWRQHCIQYVPYVKTPFQTRGITLSGREKSLTDWMDLQANSIPFKKHLTNSWVMQGVFSTEGFRGSVLRFFHQPNSSNPGVFKRMQTKYKLFSHAE